MAALMGAKLARVLEDFATLRGTFFLLCHGVCYTPLSGGRTLAPGFTAGPVQARVHHH